MSEYGPNLHLKREKLNVQNTIGKSIKQINITNQVEFPVKVKKIYDTFIKLKDIETKILSNKVVVEGEIFTQVYYVVGETCEVDGMLYEAGEIYEETFVESFNEFTEIPGITPRMDTDVQCRIQNFVWKHKGPKKIKCGQSDKWQQTVDCELFVQVTEVLKMDVVVDVSSTDIKVEALKEKLSFESIVGENNKQTEIVDEINFDKPIKKIKNIAANVKDVKFEIDPNKIVVEGILNKKIYYEELETGLLKEKALEENFTNTVELIGAREGQNVDIDVEIKYIDVDLHDGDEKTGFTSGRQTTILNVAAKVTEDIELEVVTDVKGEDLEISKELIEVDTVVAEDNDKIDVEQNIYFNRPVKKIVETGSEIKFNYTDTQLISGEAVVAGELSKQVYFVDTNEESVFEQSFDDEFKTSFDLRNATEDMNLRVKGIVEEITAEEPDYPDNIYADYEEGNFDPEKYPWKQTAVLNIIAKVTETVELEVVTDVKTNLQVEETPHSEITVETTQPSLKFYIVQPGDTLYTVGQRFNITVEEIQNNNPDIEPGDLQIGQKVLIPCRLS